MENYLTKVEHTPKKAGIVTLFGDNYGNKLQNYALQEILANIGYSAETLLFKDGRKLHCTETFSDFLRKLSPFHIKRVITSRFKARYPYKNERDGILEAIHFARKGGVKQLEQKRHDVFHKFAEAHLAVAKASLSKDENFLTTEYEAFVCGSDQIWNPTYASTDAPYFLRFAEERKRIAFAPSFGLARLPQALHPLYRKWLAEIPHLSVREEAGAEIIRELTGREVPVLPDPTLCLPREAWEMIEEKPAFDTSRYVLTYFLGNETNRYRRYVARYAKAAKAQVINLLDLREPEHYAVGPAEFVWLVHHAEAMFTDSFHGTVFSLIFHTPFVVFDRVENGGMGMSSRIETLLKRVGLSERHFPAVSQAEIPNVDFTETDAKIRSQAGQAKIFLRNAIAAAVSELKEPKRDLPEILFREKTDCSGCGACVQSCPAQCLRLQTDEDGFAYPRIDEGACLHCGRCTAICKNASNPREASEAEKAFIARTNDEKLRRESSSGGLFSELGKAVLAKGGVVCGAGFAEDFQVVHRLATTEEELSQLRGSKYVQSRLAVSFAELRKRLEAGQWVYFSGTPCQVDGFLAFLGKDYPTLVTQDIICHGVASPDVWREYLNWRSGGKPVRSVSFRDKRFGWHYFSLRIRTDDKTYRRRLDEDVFLRLFLDNVILRPSCYDCRHKHLHRKADFTIGDAWALRKMTTFVRDDDRGLSLLFVHSEKSSSLLMECASGLELTEVPFEVAARSQSALTNSVRLPSDRALFFATAAEQGLRTTIQNWFGFDWPHLLKAKMIFLKTKITCLLKKISK